MSAIYTGKFILETGIEIKKGDEKMRYLSIILVGLLILGTMVMGTYVGEGSTPPLSDILDRAKGITSVKYDMVMEVPGVPTTTTKVWMKGDDKIRMEMAVGGMTVITILNGDTMYMYYPKRNMAMKMDTSEAPESAAEEVGSIGKYKPKVIGTETMDGKICTVVEYVTPEGRTKMWIWQKHGLPVRVETTTEGGTTIIEYKNIQFGKIPDSMFKLPAGVKIMDMPEWG
ncbi:MAG: hypothetical protein MASP_01487 [Candidatus Methanolliviera sp. GoM_asphalt]|nr:MAG: hypothetical protein MASP_01487 [Candidatus Methanolliviera sp. GoM_asphalt]